MSRIGFLVNPIAGMGGRVGLKGTDDVVEMAIKLGAHPIAHLKASETLREVRKLLHQTSRQIDLSWFTCAGRMGAECLKEAGFKEFEVDYDSKGETTSDDTRAAIQRFQEINAELILFCGGDGTARDVCSITRQRTPILGIPSGVKMYSGVFGINPAKTAEILIGFLKGGLDLTKVDIVDLDEEKYRQGEWVVRLYDSALTPYEPTLTQVAKMLIAESTGSEVKQEIAEYLIEEIEAEPDVLYLLGPGSTVESIGKRLNIDKTLLGIDGIADGKMVGKDLNESQLLDLVDKYQCRRLILSPIGAQGFILGRGNLQLSPEVIRKVGPQNIIVVATPAKLARTPVLRFDTGDASLDTELSEKGYISVVIGYRLRRLAKVEM